MKHIEQVEINGTSYNLLDRQDLIDLICDHMGSQVAALLECEFKEMQEDFNEQLLEMQENLKTKRE